MLALLKTIVVVVGILFGLGILAVSLLLYLEQSGERKEKELIKKNLDRSIYFECQNYKLSSSVIVASKKTLMLTYPSKQDWPEWFKNYPEDGEVVFSGFRGLEPALRLVAGNSKNKI